MLQPRTSKVVNRYLGVMRQLPLPPLAAQGRVENAAVDGGAVPGAEVRGQQQELAVEGQLKVQLAHPRPAASFQINCPSNLIGILFKVQPVL